MITEEYKSYLLNKVKEAPILVETKMLLLDCIDEFIENLDEVEIIESFKKNDIVIETLTVWNKNQNLKKLLDNY